MENRKIIKLVLFNLLVILTMTFIFLLFFPKKSYIESKINDDSNNSIMENNIKNMKLAALNYFEKNNVKKVSLKELLDKELINELKDNKGISCSNESYAEKENEKIKINLTCDNVNKEEEIDLSENQNNKLICIYEYQKEKNKEYTDWSEWSDWSKEKIEKTNLTNVETKEELEQEGTKIEIIDETITKPANKNIKAVCPKGYAEVNSQCKTKTRLNTISASVLYTCPNGYKKNGVKCYSNTSSINAEKKYYCPSGDKYIEFELSNEQCQVYKISYANKEKDEIYYTCDEGYKLSGDTCYKTVQREEEVDNYKKITYYRYQTRTEKPSKYDIKWSIKNDKELLEQEYNMVREITCDF